MHNPSQQNYIQQLSIDCVIFGYHNKHLKVLIPKLNFNGNFYALPSGFVDQNEDIDQAAQRILEERTGLKNIYLEEFKVFGNADRNNAAFLNRLIALNPEKLGVEKQNEADHNWFSKRFVSIGYYALVDFEKVIPKTNPIDAFVSWYSIDDMPDMILDHNQIVKSALKALRSDLDEKLSAFNLLPATFTMKEIQEVYETIFDRPFVRTNFQKKILDLNLLKRLEKKFTGAANKAPYLYKLNPQ